MNREKEIFDQATDIAGAAEREAFVRKTCGPDAALCRRVLDLLQALETASRFLPGQPKELSVDLPVLGVEMEGAVIDRYRLLEKIGEGGFGVVFMAEQVEPVRRRVALKIIKPNMDSRQVIRRFEAERQALALMNHPNIAQVLDAGTTVSGVPYFVMELVKGIPITRFCEEAHLSLEARVRLFLEVCSAVQHAHQKGIIHRDLKPSNLLVTLHGERPVPKVIDFGIAKATQEPLTDKTVFTQFQQFLGTPAYMSPEQAALSGLDVDTRSDVFSLGVVLYELLTGAPPVDSRELLSAGLDGMRKIICEREAQRPSTRLAKHRHQPSSHTEAARASSMIGNVARELDFIVLKALEKDRDRRYATANGLAADLQRYLNHEPVTAVAPTFAYQLAKLYRRNRKTVVTAVAFAALLLVAAVVGAGLAIRAQQAEAEARRQAASARNVSDFLWRELLKRLTPWSHTNAGVSLREAFDAAAARIDFRLTKDPVAEAGIRVAFGRTYLGLGEFATAETNLVRAIELHRAWGDTPDLSTAEALFQLGTLREFQGRWTDGAKLVQEAADIRARLLGETHRDAVSAAAKAALLDSQTRAPADVVPVLQRHLDLMRRHVGRGHFVERALLNRLGVLQREAGDLAGAYDRFVMVHRLVLEEEGEFSAGELWSRELIAQTQALQGNFEEAERKFLEVVAIRTRITSSEHPSTFGTQLQLCEYVLLPQKRHAEAATLLASLAESARINRPDYVPVIASFQDLLLKRWQEAGGGPECEKFSRQIVDARGNP